MQLPGSVCEIRAMQDEAYVNNLAWVHIHLLFSRAVAKTVTLKKNHKKRKDEQGKCKRVMTTPIR